jgi:hypothetical protein
VPELALSTLAADLAASGWDGNEARRVSRLVDLFLDLPAPPDAPCAFPGYTRLRDRLAEAVETEGPEEVEARILELYAHLHMNEAPYSPDERRRMDRAGGYWNHAGGLSPILKAGPWIAGHTVSADLGAGNGLQGLLLQALYPHARTVQVEISARLRDVGEGLREWLGIPRERVTWIVDDLLNGPAAGYDFIYLYRPLRPEGPGRDFYARFAREVESQPRPPVIFSVADCLRGVLSDRYEVFYGDGHLTCFRPVSRVRTPASGRGR